MVRCKILKDLDGKKIGLGKNLNFFAEEHAFQYNKMKKGNQSLAFPPKVIPTDDVEPILFQLPGASDDHNHKGCKNMKE